MRDVVDVELDRDELGSHRVGNLVDHDDLRQLEAGQRGQELANQLDGGRCGQHDGRPGVAQRGLKTLGVARQFGREQRHRDVTRLYRAEEPHDVVEALRCQHGHPVTARRQLLQPRRDGPQPDPELRPRQFEGLTIGGVGVIEVAVCHRVPDVGDVAVDQRYQGGTGRQLDLACGVEALLDLDQTGPAHHAVSLGGIHGSTAATLFTRREP